MASVYNYIINQVNINKASHVQAPTGSVADEIMKTKNLADQGIITADEYEIRINQLLCHK